MAAASGSSVVSLLPRYLFFVITTDLQARVYTDVNEKLGRSWWDYGM
jgi:hypothetical protein